MLSANLRWRAFCFGAILLAIVISLRLMEFVSMTVAGVLAIAILAFTNAWATLDEAHFGIIAEGPAQGYLRRFLKVEAFWRAFVTNLSFGGVSLALAIIALHSSWKFWDWNNPVLPLLLNFVMGIFAPRELRDEYEWPPNWSWGVSAVGVLFYLWAGWSACTLYPPG
jgi:hypothetical protein